MRETRFTFRSPVTVDIEKTIFPPGLFENQNRRNWPPDVRVRRLPIDEEVDKLIKKRRAPRVDLTQFASAYGPVASPHFLARYWVLRGIAHATTYLQFEKFPSLKASKRITSDIDEARLLLRRMDRFNERLSKRPRPDAVAFEVSEFSNVQRVASAYQELAASFKAASSAAREFCKLEIRPESARHLDASARLSFSNDLGIAWRLLTGKAPTKSNPFQSFVAEAWLSIPGSLEGPELNWERACNRTVDLHSQYFARITNHPWSTVSAEEIKTRRARITNAIDALGIRKFMREN